MAILFIGIAIIAIWMIGVFCGYAVGYDNGRINAELKKHGEPEIDCWKPKGR